MTRREPRILNAGLADLWPSHREISNNLICDSESLK